MAAEHTAKARVLLMGFLVSAASTALLEHILTNIFSVLDSCSVPSSFCLRAEFFGYVHKLDIPVSFVLLARYVTS